MSNPITPESPASAPPPLNFIALLRQMLKTSDKVSDLIFSPGRPPQVELAGKLQPVRFPGLEKLTPAHTASIAKLIIGNHEAATESIEKTGSADLSFSAPGEARFRVNIFKQRGTYAIVMRVIPTNPPNFDDFRLARAVEGDRRHQERNRSGDWSNRQRQEFNAGGDYRSD